MDHAPHEPPGPPVPPPDTPHADTLGAPQAAYAVGETPPYTDAGRGGYAPPGNSARVLGTLVLDLIGMAGLALPVLGAVWMLSVGVSILAGPLFAVMFTFILLLGLVLIGSAVRRVKRERGAALLSYVELGVRLNLPLPEFLETLGRGEGALLGQRAQRMAWTLREGGGLGEAICRHAKDLPATQAAVVWRGEQSGRLREAVARASGNLRRQNRDARATHGDAAMQYAMLVMVVLLGLMGLFSVILLPKYINIFNDFDVDFPAITRITFQNSGLLSLVLVLGSLAGLLLLVGWSAYGMVRDSQAVGGPMRRVLEPVLWRLPVLSRSMRSAAWADACFMIEQAMRAGQPLPDAIESAGHPAICGVVDRRLARFARHLRAGRGPADAARAARLPAFIVGMLGTANAAAQPADTFAYLCRYYTHRVSIAEQLVRATALPLLTLALASAVAWFVFALFYPLVILIERTLEVTGYA